MLELKEYIIKELHEYFQTSSKEGLERKMERYGIEYTSAGRGAKTIYSILAIPDPLKLYFVFDLGIEPQTDFIKARNYLYCFFNDDEFAALPYETQALLLEKEGKKISRSTIGKLMGKFEKKEYLHGYEYLYYFAYKGYREMTDQETYNKAWREYWRDLKKEDYTSKDAIFNMIVNYGGVARKQRRIIANVVHEDKMDTLNELIINSIIEEQQLLSQSINK